MELVGDLAHAAAVMADATEKAMENRMDLVQQREVEYSVLRAGTGWDRST